MTWLKRVACGLMLVTSGAVSVANAQNANDQKKRIVVLGDSITAGYGLDPQEAYPALLQQKIDTAKLPYSVTNAGVSGDTSSGGLRRIDWVLGQKGADVLLIALGGNDGLRGVSPTETEKNLSGIIDKARAKNPQIKIVLIGMEMPPNMGAEFTATFKAVFPKVASAKNVQLIPFLLQGVGGDLKLNQPDRIHPTAEGQKIIADHVWKDLEKQL
jgi:acyl-CoA thioesterase I